MVPRALDSSSDDAAASAVLEEATPRWWCGMKADADRVSDSATMEVMQILIATDSKDVVINGKGYCR